MYDGSELGWETGVRDYRACGLEMIHEDHLASNVMSAGMEIGG